jgi:hypothetical protein
VDLHGGVEGVEFAFVGFEVGAVEVADVDCFCAVVRVLVCCCAADS